MKLKLFLFILVGLFITNCAKSPAKIDSIKYDIIGQQVIENTTLNIIKDPKLNYTWVKNYLFYFNGNILVDNNKKINFFYYAHNSDQIYIFARKELAEKYAFYLKHNGVTANIVIYDFIADEPNLVNVIFKHK